MRGPGMLSPATVPHAFGVSSAGLFCVNRPWLKFRRHLERRMIDARERPIPRLPAALLPVKGEWLAEFLQLIDGHLREGTAGALGDEARRNVTISVAYRQQ